MVIVRLPWELDEADSVRVESVKNRTKTVVSILGSQFFSVVCIFSSRRKLHYLPYQSI